MQALQHTRVDLTWDTTDSKRERNLKRDFSKSEVDMDDFEAYLASGSEEESEGEQKEKEDREEQKVRQREDMCVCVREVLRIMCERV